MILSSGGGQPLQLKNNSSSYTQDRLHISSLNPYFCELTAMYWAWKNLKADYYGLFHYRRVFDFRDSFAFDMPRAEKVVFCSKTQNLTKDFYDKYALCAESIEQICSEADIVLPTKVIDHDKKERAVNLSMYGIYECVHYAKDLDTALEYIQQKYPQMYDIALKTLHEKPVSWHIANMFIMKKELYFEYCEWIFDILFALQDKIPYKSYDAYQARVFGFLSERLFNVYIAYQKSHNKQLKIKELPLVLLKFKTRRRWLGWVQESGGGCSVFMCVNYAL